MARFVIEHLPKTAARYTVMPLAADQVRLWLSELDFHCLVRTTELAGAVRACFGVTLTQADQHMALKSGDEALLLSLSFGVLLAWAEGRIPPLDDDWRCFLVEVEADSSEKPPLPAAAVEDKPAG